MNVIYNNIYIHTYRCVPVCTPVCVCMYILEGILTYKNRHGSKVNRICLEQNRTTKI